MSTVSDAVYCELVSKKNITVFWTLDYYCNEKDESATSSKAGRRAQSRTHSPAGPGGQPPQQVRVCSSETKPGNKKNQRYSRTRPHQVAITNVASMLHCTLEPNELGHTPYYRKLPRMTQFSPDGQFLVSSFIGILHCNTSLHGLVPMLLSVEETAPLAGISCHCCEFV